MSLNNRAGRDLVLPRTKRNEIVSRLLAIAVIVGVSLGIGVFVGGRSQRLKASRPSADGETIAVDIPINRGDVARFQASTLPDRPSGPPDQPPEVMPASEIALSNDTLRSPPSAKRELDDELSRLRATGPAIGGWTATAFGVFDKWKTASPAAGQVTFGEFACFAGGCTIKVTYKDRPAFETATQDFQDSEQFNSWQGPKFRSAPFQLESGSVEAVWILFKV